MNRKLILALLIAASCLVAEGQDWQAKAVAKYPELGVKGSDMNQKFLAAYNERQKASPIFFNHPQWPVLLADEVAAAANSEKLAATLNWKAGTPIVIVGIVVALVVFASLSSRAKRQKLVSDARRFLALANQSGRLPTAAASIKLKAGESAFYCAPSILYETRSVRHYESGFAGFRVAKGVVIGGSRGRSVSSQEWGQIDAGTLTVTNSRLISIGTGSERSVALSKLLSANSSGAGVEVWVENRQKSMIFSAPNPLILATVIRVCSSVDDPLDLSGTPIEIEYKG